MSWSPESEQREPGPFTACFCESGKRYQDCCKKRLRYYVFDHPCLFDLWDVLAYSAEDALERFRDAWEGRTAAGGSHEHLAGASFEDGSVRLTSPEEQF